MQRYPQPCELPEGIKLRVYGTAFAAYSRQKNKAEPLLKVHTHTCTLYTHIYMYMYCI